MMSAHPKRVQRVAIATTGGDAPGMNACIRSIVLECQRSAIVPLGVRRGALGLIRAGDDDFFILERDHVRNVIERGSTMLGSAREEEFIPLMLTRSPSLDEIAARVWQNLRQREVDSLILIGGDTTLASASKISIASARALPIVVIPASIDNDVHGTDLTIGYDTALHETSQYIDKVRETARAFERIFIIETMGNRCSLLAAEAAIISGAEELLVPELPLDIEKLEALCNRVVNANRSVLIVVAEGAKLPEPLAGQRIGESPAALLKLILEQRLCGSREIRVGNPGYIFRGASPTAFSRLMALEAGAKAVAWLKIPRGADQSFAVLRFDRNAAASAFNAGQIGTFTADRTMRIKKLVELVNDQGY